ncbi:MAG TPA: MGMT family protein [Candidatus Pygmaiobacter gallistercoris]|nr:MGMT family protein [Candidatus Pygmaiobacter gallistercoris]
MPSPFAQRIYEVVKQIPRGKVATYGQVAALAGNPRGARGVGFALHHNPQPGIIPCHRVIFRDGSLCTGFAFGGPEVQRRLLEQEGVCFLPDGRVDLSRFGWLGRP